MKAGDIIQFDYDDFLNIGWRKWLNKLIKIFDGDVNHSALYLSSGYIIEASDESGVRKRKIRSWEKYHVLRVKPELNFKNFRASLDDYYENTKEMKYSSRDWINSVFNKIAYKLTGKRLELFENDKTGFICSEYIQDFYWRYYGIDLCQFTQTETPNDFEESQYLYKTKQKG